MTFEDTLDVLVTLAYPEREQYLRDLKASHDALLAAAKAMDSKLVIEYGFLDHQYELSQLRAAIKAAEGLK